MRSWSIVFLILVIVAGALGFGGVAGAFTSIAQALFVIFLVLLMVSLGSRVLRRRGP